MSPIIKEDSQRIGERILNEFDSFEKERFIASTKKKKENKISEKHQEDILDTEDFIKRVTANFKKTEDILHSLEKE